MKTELVLQAGFWEGSTAGPFVYWCNGGSGHIGTELKKGKELFEC